ncbi:MAG TPA: hypothetical protein VG125_01590 [Pirellulales bacterium]|nr:hypothetical protein [Pirellulales bacterium]
MKIFKSLEDVGLPSNRFWELTYHPPTKSVVVLTGPKKSEPPCMRLSIRMADEPKYREVAVLPDNVSIKSFTLSSKLPLLFLNTWTVSKYEQYERKGILATLGLPHHELEREPVRYMADWDALYRYDILTRSSEVVARRGELHAFGEYSRVWLTDLLGVSDDASALYVKAGIERDRIVDYHVCSLNLSGLLLTPITKLEAVFA